MKKLFQCCLQRRFAGRERAGRGESRRGVVAGALLVKELGG